MGTSKFIEKHDVESVSTPAYLSSELLWLLLFLTSKVLVSFRFSDRTGRIVVVNVCILDSKYMVLG